MWVWVKRLVERQFPPPREGISDDEIRERARKLEELELRLLRLQYILEVQTNRLREEP